MKLTKNFDSSEFVVSKQFPELLSDITLNEIDLYKLFVLCMTLMQPIREAFGIVTNLSGKRSPKLNQAVGGVATSDHLFLGKSCATDFRCDHLDQVQEFLRQECYHAFGQSILYLDKDGSPIFMHLSLPTDKHHREFLVKQKGKITK